MTSDIAHAFAAQRLLLQYFAAAASHPHSSPSRRVRPLATSLCPPLQSSPHCLSINAEMENRRARLIALLLRDMIRAASCCTPRRRPESKFADDILWRLFPSWTRENGRRCFGNWQRDL